MLTETPPAPATSGLSLDRFVDRLFASLAWEATVWLGDPAVASRLVERVLHRVWAERERFTSADALLRHAQESARGAIQREAERRLDVTRFDDGGVALPVPGDLQLMSVEAVLARLQEGRRPAATPAVPMQTIAVAAAPQAELMRPMAPAARPSGAVPLANGGENGASSSAAIGANGGAASSETNGPTNGAAARSSQATLRPSQATLRSSQATPRLSQATAMPTDGARRSAARPKLRGAAYMEEHAGKRWSPRVVGAVVGVAAVLLAVAWRVTHSEPPLARAIAALADTTGLTKTTAHGQQADVAFPGGATVHLGPDAEVRASATFEHGPRALRLSGPARVAIPTDSSLPTVIGTGVHRWMTHGAVAAFASDGARMLVRVDSGAIDVLADSLKGRVTAGEAASVDPVAGFALLSSADAKAAFAWGDGRLVLARGPVRRATAAALQWFDLEVRYQPERTAADSVAVDVPLATPDSLLAVLAASANGSIERTGKRVLIKASARPAAPTRTAKPVFAKPAPAIPGLFDKP